MASNTNNNNNNNNDANDEIFLADLYMDPSSPASFSSADKLLREARKKGRKDITLKRVKDFLTTQDSYTKHGTVPKTFRKSIVFVHGPGHLLSSDLADVSNIAHYNEGYNFLAFFIDCFSRKLTVYPIKNKKGLTVARVLDHFLKHSIHTYTNFWVDRGGEYYNNQVRKICEKHKLNMYSVYNYGVKAALAERSIRTIKTKLYKMFTHYNTYNYTKFLDRVVSAYNDTPHSGLVGLTPNKVHTMRGDTRELASRMVERKQRNYGVSGHINRRRWRLDLSLKDILPEGAHVRLLANSVEGAFNKSYLPIYTGEVFTIDKINKGENPITYTLKDLNEAPIKGRVYRNEIIKVSKPEIFDVEKIVSKRYCKKHRKYKVLVKYLHYPDSFNQWLWEQDIVKKASPKPP